jgi:acetyl esterase/lipase
LVLTAQDDPMRDESQRYARRLRESGVPVQQDVLTAPTGWPCALACPESAGKPWAAALRECAVTFFAATAASRLSASTLQPLPA